MTDQSQQAFRIVRHGYDPGEVDRRLAKLSQTVGEANGRVAELTDQLGALQREHEEAKAAQKPMPPAEPTFHDFGKRVGSILALAEEEADEMRAAAVAEVRTRLAD